MNRQSLLFYAAGYFDGEGCVTMMSMDRGRYRYLRIAVVSADRESLQVFADLFGGSVKLQTRHRKTKEHHRVLYRWSKNGTAAQRALRELQQLLRSMKAAQALSALAIPYRVYAHPAA